MTILGISALYHDSAAALVGSAGIERAAHEERFTRKKHDPSWPENAVAYCLADQGTPDWVAFYDDPQITYDRIVATCLEAGEKGYPLWERATRKHLTVNSQVSDRLAAILPDESRRVFVQHHHSHAASAFYPSPFEEAAILVADAVGEWTTTSIYRGTGNEMTLLRRVRFPDSLGILYSAFTQFCGFKVNSGEYKLMGLAPFGQPRFAEKIRTHVLKQSEDGAFVLDQRYFDLFSDRTMFTPALSELLSVEAREPEAAFQQEHLDVAASIQQVLNDAMVRLARTAMALAGSDNLCMAGGVALNCVSNAEILNQLPKTSLWIQPAAGDAGGALGAALYVNHAMLDQPRAHVEAGRDAQHGSLLGPSFSNADVIDLLERKGVPYTLSPDRAAHLDEVAQALNEGLIVGRFQGRMEFGPRALGARSILADASRPNAQSTVNRKIKFREGWRPFAPAVLAEQASQWFSDARESPYMLKTTRLLETRLRRSMETPDAPDAECERDLVQTLADSAQTSDLPAITHVDGSARLQTVDCSSNPDFHAQISAFEAVSGIPIVLNTSFNVRGEPIVCTPADALECFLDTEMDLLSIEDCLVRKSELPDALKRDHAHREFERD